jgi:hypothetical protein
MARPSGHSMHVCHHRRRAERRADAVIRQQSWICLTPEEKLADLDRRPGESKRERARLQKEITA